MKNCYVVIGHPNTPEKFKLLLDNLSFIYLITLKNNFFFNNLTNYYNYNDNLNKIKIINNFAKYL